MATLGRLTPVLRIFDEAKAREFCAHVTHPFHNRLTFFQNA